MPSTFDAWHNTALPSDLHLETNFYMEGGFFCSATKCISESTCRPIVVFFAVGVIHYTVTTVTTQWHNSNRSLSITIWCVVWFPAGSLTARRWRFAGPPKTGSFPSMVFLGRAIKLNSGGVSKLYGTYGTAVPKTDDLVTFYHPNRRNTVFSNSQFLGASTKETQHVSSWCGSDSPSNRNNIYPGMSSNHKQKLQCPYFQ